ncbi:MAG: hypothetical protein ABEI53_00835 [Candidatus Magasanikbacteria bacterium]
MSEIEVTSVNPKEETIKIKVSGSPITFQKIAGELRAIKAVNIRFHQIPGDLKAEIKRRVEGIAKDRFKKPA